MGPVIRGTDMNRDPTSAVLLRLSPKKSRRSTYNTPNENAQPSAMRFAQKEARTTTQPHPPSGGVGRERLESELLDQLLLLDPELEPEACWPILLSSGWRGRLFPAPRLPAVLSFWPLLLLESSCPDSCSPSGILKSCY